MKYITNTYVLWIAKVFIGLIFVLSGIEKIADPAGFSDAIANYKLMPNFIINFFAISIPWIELVCGILIIFNQNIKENAFIYLSLMSIFTIMVLIAVLRGLDIDCGCFGTQNVQAVGITKIIENLALIFLGVYVFIYNDKSTHKVS